MSRIDDLIAEHCPAGVHFKALGEVGAFVRGGGLQKKDFVADGFPCIHYGQIYTFYGTTATVTKSFIAPELAARLKQAETGDLVITTTSENIEDVCTAVAWLGEGPIAIGGHSCVFRHTLDPMYAAYYFQTEQFELQKRKFVTGTKVKDIKIGDIARVRIPVPPLAIQREIAAILDKMENLKAELESELELRSRQYAFYRDSLLTFAERDRVRWAKLSELLREPLANGRSVPDGSGYPVLRLTALRGPVVDVAQHKLGAWDAAVGRRFRIEAGDLLVVRGNGSKDLIARASMVEKTDELAFPDTMIRVRPDLTQVSQRYLFHVWESPATRVQLQRVAKLTSGVWKVSQDDLSGVVLPVPTLEEQDRIVRILDELDALVNDLSMGLPAEIKARQAQYEYYRNKLLTFEELAA